MPSQKFYYPQPAETRTGCKVMWRTYDNLEDAQKASEIAVQDAEYRASLGYDFGFCCPGSISVLQDGMFEVCCP